MSDHPLKSAARNPWYLLLTVYGEQGEKYFDAALHNRNRRIWNGWALGHLPPEERQRLAKEAKIDIAEAPPLTDDEMKDVRARFDAVLGQGHVLPDPTEPVEFFRTQFSVILATSNCVFYSLADFEGATFTRWADFRGATFTGYADFAHATFTEGADFEGATLAGGADFEGATFTGWAGFQGATFTSWATFQGATFTEEANFKGATFAGWADFQGATFTGGADFGGATFTGGAYFARATFTELAHFKGATFTEKADFQDATFADSAFFNDAIFKSTTDFRAKSFAYVPRIHATQLHEDTRFTLNADTWPKPKAHMAERAASDYSRLRHFMNKLQKPEDEHFFFRQEMRCRALIGGWWHRLPIRAFGWVSDFGHSFWRPTIGLGATWFAPFLIYLSVFSWSQVLHDGAEPWGPSFGLASSSTFGLFGFSRIYHSDLVQSLPDSLMFLSGLQTILGFTFLFFLGLGLRNRFRLR